MKKQEKTNVMRILDQHGIPYQSYDYSGTGAVGGTEVAEVLGEDPAHVFKTLVTVGKSGQHYVFDIPVAEELDLKKAAAAVGEKSIAMIRAKELLPLTGYVHGGCSPVGMKKPFPTVFHLTAESLNMVFVSAGRIGSQIEVAPGDLQKIVPFSYADVCVD
ncbi:MAG: Cys-tRNA(Pro) deacylase [Firmicutes bacterium]|nr:Cys-tRNA(Pro) deacylase [Bacillota bacterium]